MTGSDLIQWRSTNSALESECEFDAAIDTEQALALACSLAEGEIYESSDEMFTRTLRSSVMLWRADDAAGLPSRASRVIAVDPPVPPCHGGEHDWSDERTVQPVGPGWPGVSVTCSICGVTRATVDRQNGERLGPDEFFTETSYARGADNA